MDAATRKAINEASVRRFFASWDPAWRWVLILGLRDMRAHPDRLGELAAREVGSHTWADESYAYGPLALGITAAAVNEAAQHCEDLFALLTFLREPLHFAKRMGSYSAGKVTSLAPRIRGEGDWAIGVRFLVPSSQTIQEGLQDAEDGRAAIDAAEAGVARLGQLVRQVVDFYLTYEFFHVQYKHGLKLPLRPFSDSLPAETIADRQRNVSAPLIALTNESLSNMLQRPPSQRAIMLPDPGPDARPHLSELVTDRELFRFQMSGLPVDLDDVLKVSWTVVRLLRLAASNRQAVGTLDEDGFQTFQLPGASELETMTVTLKLAERLRLEDFS
jgi:hypothetical protein